MTQRFATLADQLEFYKQEYLRFYMPGKTWNYQMQKKLEKENLNLHQHMQRISARIQDEQTVPLGPNLGRTHGSNASLQDQIHFARTVILKVDKEVWDSLSTSAQLNALRSVPHDFIGYPPPESDAAIERRSK